MTTRTSVVTLYLLVISFISRLNLASGLNSGAPACKSPTCLSLANIAAPTNNTALTDNVITASFGLASLPKNPIRF